MARPNDAAAIGAHIRGLRELKAAFQQLPQITRERMNDATETTVREIVRHAKEHLIASPSIVTRSLYNAVGWSLNRNNGRGRAGVMSVWTTLMVGTTKVKVKGIIVPGKGGSALISAGARQINPRRYAHLVEFGARHMPAEPFMIPAADAQKGPALDRMKRAGQDIERDMTTVGSRFD